MNVLSNSEVNEKLKEASGWSFKENSINKEFQLRDFKEALQLVNKIGNEAEKMDHHPDILLHSWNKVKITISTHSAGGVTENDFKLAKAIEWISK